MKSQLFSNIQEWPITKLSNDREQFVNKVIKDVEAQYNQFSASELDQTLSKTIFQERQRVKSNPWKADPPNEALYFRKLFKEYNESKESDISFQKNKETVYRLIHRYAEEISGNFNIATFYFARKVLGVFFHLLYFPFGLKLFSSTKKKQKRLEKRMIVNGEIDLVRKLFEENTIILVPTHSSNLDSVLVGYMSDTFGGLPAFSYGAGLNLYDSEFFAFFMNRLGAYRVDRRKKNQIYLHTLIAYSRLIAERGVNTIFFPGGTRSRSGEVETKLKLGLLNSVLLAQRSLLERNESRKIILVPTVIGYESVLEARSLIIQHLKTTGQEKFIVKEKSSPVREYIKFIFGLLKKKSRVYLTFGAPIDVFGNRIDESGNSINHLNSKIQLKDYFMREGRFVHDAQRESIYTKELAESIVDKYRKYNFITPAYLVAYCAFKMFEKAHSGQDHFSLVQLPEEELNFPIDEFKEYCSAMIKSLKILQSESKAMISEELDEPIEIVIEKGILSVGVLHNRKVLYIETNMLMTDDLFTLYYYHNKMKNLESELSD
ncbi:MAG: 1-acyl-sn-glycerol-3-phosphate acyltransferase [Saprospiraceae bacterium]